MNPWLRRLKVEDCIRMDSGVLERAKKCGDVLYVGMCCRWINKKDDRMTAMAKNFISDGDISTAGSMTDRLYFESRFLVDATCGAFRADEALEFL